MNSCLRSAIVSCLVGIFVILALGPTTAQADGVLDACPVALAVSVICFDDLTDGPPIVLTNIPGATIGVGIESATVTFTGVPVVGPFPRSYALLETAGDFNPPNSDVVSLLDPSTVLFQSDISSSPPTLGPPAGTLLEDGSFQEFDVSPALSIFVRSDVSSPESVPEPRSLTLTLFGLSLAGLVSHRRRTMV